MACFSYANFIFKDNSISTNPKSVKFNKIEVSFDVEDCGKVKRIEEFFDLSNSSIMDISYDKDDHFEAYVVMKNPEEYSKTIKQGSMVVFHEIYNDIPIDITIRLLHSNKHGCIVNAVIMFEYTGDESNFYKNFLNENAYSMIDVDDKRYIVITINRKKLLDQFSTEEININTCDYIGGFISTAKQCIDKLY